MNPLPQKSTTKRLAITTTPQLDCASVRDPRVDFVNAVPRIDRIIWIFCCVKALKGSELFYSVEAGNAERRRVSGIMLMVRRVTSAFCRFM